MSKWEDDSIQFPRLLAELSAVELPTKLLEEVAESMDLSLDEVGELFERADIAWEKCKRDALREEQAQAGTPSVRPLKYAGEARKYVGGPAVVKWLREKK
jgi:hypothetical protein